ncbi:hypothetical protein F5879DRAFT_996427 [Lentinula edodes]|nr:hypothetical protein F5879DRAFT_996427 [Lentinula edodes]
MSTFFVRNAQMPAEGAEGFTECIGNAAMRPARIVDVVAQASKFKLGADIVTSASHMAWETAVHPQITMAALTSSFLLPLCLLSSLRIMIALIHIMSLWLETI